MSLSGSFSVQPIAAKEMPQAKIAMEATIRNAKTIFGISFPIIIKLHQAPGVPFLVVDIQVVLKRGAKRDRLA